MRKPEPEKDRSERYLLTYADLMNLLLILFIILFSTSTQDVVKTSAVMQAIKEGFTGGGASAPSVSVSGSSHSSGGISETSDYSDFYKHLIELLKERGVINKVDITAQSNEVVISLKDNVLFAPGKADLGDDAVSLLSTIGGMMKQISFGQLIVEGHTDSDPIHTAQFRDNRELSLIRAYNVANVLQSTGIPSKKVLPVGYGEDFPVAKNDTVENKAKNRRVVLTILRKGVTPADGSVTTSDIVQTMQNAAAGKTDSESGAKPIGSTGGTSGK